MTPKQNCACSWPASERGSGQTLLAAGQCLTGDSGPAHPDGHDVQVVVRVVAVDDDGHVPGS
jgi:hypothetical protein